MLVVMRYVAQREAGKEIHLPQPSSPLSGQKSLRAPVSPSVPFPSPATVSPRTHSEGYGSRR